MAKYEIPPGHNGNLTAEQEDKLRQLWQTVFTLYDMFEANDPSLGIDEFTSEAAAQNLAAQREVSKKQNAPMKRMANNLTVPKGGSIADHFIALAKKDNVDTAAFTKRFREMLEAHTVESIRSMVIEAVKHDHPDALALRFLRARKWDVERSLVMMITAMNWRYFEAKVDSDIMCNGEKQAVKDEKHADGKKQKVAADFMKQLRMGKAYVHGSDREGRPISVVRVRLHKPFDQSAESLERFITYTIETARFGLAPPIETACLIFDMTGFSLANMDYTPLKFIIQCFEANYPESLGVVLVHNAPWVFKGIWKVIHGWLDPVVAAKVNFTYGRKDLEKFIAPDHIIKELGGDEDWEFSYVEPIKGENKAMKDTATRDKLLAERTGIALDFERLTRDWILAESEEERNRIKAEREKVLVSARENYWRLDPYVRARSINDRWCDFSPNGPATWYPHEKEATRALQKEAKRERKAAKKADVNGIQATMEELTV